MRFSRGFLFLSLIIILLVLISSNRSYSQSQSGTGQPTTKTEAATPATPTPKTETQLLEDEALESIKIGAEVVLVNVLVTDSKNRYIEKLTQADLEVYEDGKKQEMSFFTKQNEPLSLGILVDTSQSMIENSKVEEARNAVRAIIEKSNPKDEICLMKFDERVAVLQDFTSDSKLLYEQVNRLKPFGGTALYDALVQGMKHINRKAKQLRQALILITDGIDQKSRNKLKDVLPVAQLTGIPCYVIGIYTEREREIFAQKQEKLELESGEFVDNPSIAMQNIADETAGRVFFPASEKELLPTALKIINELHSGYALGYYPPSSSLDGKYHSIVVTSKVKKYSVRARRGYVARIAN